LVYGLGWRLGREKCVRCTVYSGVLVVKSLLGLRFTVAPWLWRACLIFGLGWRRGRDKLACLTVYGGVLVASSMLVMVQGRVLVSKRVLGLWVRVASWSRKACLVYGLGRHLGRENVFGSRFGAASVFHGFGLRLSREKRPCFLV